MLDVGAEEMLRVPDFGRSQGHLFESPADLIS